MIPFLQVHQPSSAVYSAIQDFNCGRWKIGQNVSHTVEVRELASLSNREAAAFPEESAALCYKYITPQNEK